MNQYIEYRDALYREPNGYGKRVRQVEATWGCFNARGANRTEARANLLADIDAQLQHTFTRRYLCAPWVTFALGYANGWRYDIVAVKDNGRRSSSAILGGDLTEDEAFASMHEHFEQYVIGTDAVDRTNGELAAAVRAHRDDESEANRARLRAAERAHVAVFYAEQEAKSPAASA